MTGKRKIINDPVYGFITINDPLIFKIIAHSCYQRLRRIHQMALAYLVYPGAVHTRLHHSLGAYHLMCNALNELKNKGTIITAEEEVAAKAAILLHDVGHGPFSHALENQLMQGVHHESLSLAIMQKMNEEFNGDLSMAIDIFTNQYPKKFLHQLVSGQLDVDRMDYLTRDSFFTGVSEGVIGYDRILKMLVVHNDELMVEEKGIYSIEKFLVSRRLMYWQVYLHKTVVSAEKMMVQIIRRVRYLSGRNQEELKTGTAIDFFLFEFNGKINNEVLEKFCELDDVDFSAAVKIWAKNKDVVLQQLCKKLLNRDLLKVQIQASPFKNDFIEQKTAEAKKQLNLSNEEAGYFVFTDEIVNTMYKSDEEQINIFQKNGLVKNISSIEDSLIQQTISAPVKKFYICTLS